MVFTVLYPGIAFLAMFIVLVIMVMLKHGPKLCGLKHSLVDDRQGYGRAGDGEGYDHRISVAWEKFWQPIFTF